MAAQSSESVKLTNQPLFTPRHVRMVCVGAGFAGLMLAHRIEYNTELSFIDLRIYEKNASVGGTWYENKYPGAACDVPSHIYTFPFAPNPNWSHFYSPCTEILDYIQNTADRFGLNKYVKLNSRVVSSVWSDERGVWIITIDHVDPSTGETSTETIESEFFVNGSGILNKKKLPEITGLNSFKGPLVHSAAWDSSLDWRGKRVGVIGNGSSAIQLMPQLQETAAHVVEYIRSPTWIIPDFLTDFTPSGTNFEYTREQKQRWTENPQELRDLRRKMEHAFNTYFGIFKQAAPGQAYVREQFTQLMRTRLNNDEELIAKLLPQFPVGCRRITPGHGYLEALQQDNVSVNFDPISHITETGIVTRTKSIGPKEDGSTEEETSFDILILATGFDTTFKPAWTVRGRQGTDLADLWSTDPEAYLGVFAPSMPNYFIYNGPNCPIGHGSLMGAMEATTTLILDTVRKAATQGYKSFCVQDDVIREYNDYSQEWLKDSVWAHEGCSSWYKRRSDNRVTAMYAGSVLHYREMLANVRWEDFDWESVEKRNRFRFMGDGTTKLEADGGALGDYLEM